MCIRDSAGPVVVVVPLGLDLVVGLALLLNPGVVLEVVDSLAVMVRQFEHVVNALTPVSYTHLRAHETVLDLVCRLLLAKKNNK